MNGGVCVAYTCAFPSCSVSVHACLGLSVCVCVLDGGKGGFIINQGPSLSVRAAHTLWLND